MRTDRWLIIRDAPGQPLVVLAATDDYQRALALYGEASTRFEDARLIPHPDRVASLILTPDGGGEEGRKATATDDDTRFWRRITALALMHLAGHLGAVFWLEGNDLRVRVPQDFPATGAVRAAMAHYEPELLEFARAGYRDALWAEVLRRPLGGAAA
ncbi:MAG TPA: hypothetical protein VIK99_07775 [Thermaerobacter sp.]